MFYRPFNANMLRVLIIVGALTALSVLVLPVYNLAFAQEDGPIEYAENGMGPVATYTATDPEGTAIVSWMVGGTDGGAFMIDGGVLRFKKAPDYEIPADIVGATVGSTAAANDNTYEVMVTAMDSTGETGEKPVMVKVTNEEEMGMVELSARQPGSGVVFTATLTDPDSVTIDDLTGLIDSGTTWQWESAPSKNGSYTDIDGAMAETYTPTDAAGKSDNGRFLRATVSYTDGEGSDKTAMMTSEYAVQALRGTNNAPKFADDQDPVMADNQEDAARTVLENTEAGMNIGAPVVATDADGDVLTYTLTDNPNETFDIDWATGQLMTKGELDAEGTASYTVTVRATDPAGVPQAPTVDTVNSDTVMVVITVTNVNEAPVVTGNAEVPFLEVPGDIAPPLATYMEDDPETEDVSTWSITGVDAGKFNIDAGALTFKVKPDYEMPTDANMDNVYEVTVVATDANGNRGMTMVTVTVENQNEDGVVTLSKTQPRVGVPVTASLTDPDGSITGLKWQWYDNTIDNNDLTVGAIEGATSATYTPTTEDAVNTVTLRARASYTDGDGAAKSAMVQAANVVAVDTRNKAPVFADQDMEMDGDQNESATREVAENTEAVSTDDVANVDNEPGDDVGSALTAMDPDPNAENLEYTLVGDDAALFRVRANGQIEVGEGTKLDYEDRDTYMVTVMAEDSFGASASIMVTIMVTDLDEAPEVSGDASNEYAENGMGPVATYTATDPEGTAIVSWMVGGTDGGAFMIDGGVLRFKKAPDYEIPADIVGATVGSTAAANDNTYEVMVTAMDSTGETGEKPVMVKVTNEEEMGMVELSARQPGSGVVFTATLTDPDSVTIDDLTGLIDSGTTWQWESAPSKNGSYTDIDGAMAETYTPTDAAGKSDNGRFLRATVSYTDGEGSDKTAMMTSEYAVQALRGTNNAPKFADDQDPVMADNQEDAARTVLENTEAGMNIGAPVVATDADGDVLTYTLTDNPNETFDIDWATGQLMTKGELDAEGTASYTVTVRATDPAGVPQAPTVDTVNSDTVMVVITVTNVNEAPVVTGNAEVPFLEVPGDIAPPLATYMEDDPETEDVSTWSITGVDAGKFNIDAGALTFKVKPDYEMPTDANMDNVYEVTVVATDANGNRGMTMVTVTVENQNEDGVVTLSKTQPRVGVPVTASLTDPDGSITGLKWQWYDNTIDNNDLTVGAIEGATSATYTPTTEDAVNTVTLRARASYTDGDGAAKSAMVQAANVVAVDTRNKAPVFADQDMEMDGDQNESATREVAENTEAVSTDDVANVDNEPGDDVGSALTAMDPDPNAENLEYTLVGDDAALFRVRANGQIEVGEGTKLDYEDRDTYMVTVMAEDSFGASASVMVTIMVTDLDEAPEIMVGGLGIGGRSSVTYEENGTDYVGMYTASGPNSDMATWSLSGDDMGDFMFSGGMLTFRSSPDYENPMDADMDNVYMVTIMADDGTYIDTHDVMVMVTNEDEMGRVTFWRDGADATAAAIMVGDMLGGAVDDSDGNPGDTFPIAMYMRITAANVTSWQWAKSMTPDMMDSWTNIGTGGTYTVMDDDAGYYLRATATYTDGEGIGKMKDATTMMVGAVVDEPGMVTLWASPTEELTMAPLVGDTITGLVVDPDGSVTGESWQWSRTTTPDMMASWMDIDGETNAAYMVMAGDEGHYLRVMATYTDAVGTDMDMAYSMPTMMVAAVVDEPGMVTLWAGTVALTMAPLVGDTITGLVVDPDGGVTDETWQWSRTMDTANMSSWMDIEDATNAAYMVTADDTGYYLRVMATYTDAAGTDTDMGYSMPTMMVTTVDEMLPADFDPLARYDANDNGDIERDEAIQALKDYLDDAISKDDVIETIKLYLFD